MEESIEILVFPVEQYFTRDIAHGLKILVHIV